MELSRSRKWIIVVLAALLCGAGTYYYVQHSAAKPAASTSQQQTTMKVTKGAITSMVSGTTQFKAQDMQNMVVPVDGLIKTMNLTQNQAVKKGDVLVEISVPSTESTLKEAQVSLQQMEKELANLKEEKNHMSISATLTGKLTLAANLDVGSSINKLMKVATISDPSEFKVKLPFYLQDAVQFKKGDAVELTVDGFMLTKMGSVETISRDIKADAFGNKLIYVEVTVNNDGTLSAGTMVKGSVASLEQTKESTAQGALDYIHTAAVYAGASGNIQKLNFKDGETVNQGDLIGTIYNDSLQDEIISKEAAIESQKIRVFDAEQRVKQLTITAPFDGVFSADFANSQSNVLNSYPAGAQIEANTALGAVVSLSTMQLPIAVDELDLTSIKVGQKAQVKVDALSGRTFEGEVTSVSNVGTTSNGVTTYVVVVSVQNTEQNDLKYAMTATAEIYIQDKKDIVIMPIEAVQTQRGKTYVSLQKADGTVEEQHEIQIGIRSETHVEIVSGLNEGEQVVMPTRRATTNQQFPGGGGGFPGAGGGGFSGGGMGGGGNFSGGGRN
ncbi:MULTISPECIES: HlyD family efflux transporter periplasmic adaptor subunit [unclassified Paenibacillus]|uniref:HlyD family efflux transporter periplasmic adaptor subunit n=1 Tax=unclassified Paenibacillus TaxID=185978 RepID=UPI001AE5746F|nr:MULTISPECIES: HlyD family efflux transporter periplasmic adaptor subunit [unclassified Paenibacillus]MBP1157390.1 HlyD family secretion protein [Paenibacillus sp. PvP091]MBP1171872.1 HlyD family secretion protein [Paenibacillus sp. PvR098]MBP2438253.1 HlyD family secretion protein [Paenibacillus sp. PvP052]